MVLPHEVVEGARAHPRSKRLLLYRNRGALAHGVASVEELVHLDAQYVGWARHPRVVDFRRDCDRCHPRSCAGVVFGLED